MRNMVMPGARMVMIVVMKLTAPRIVPIVRDAEAEHPEVASDARREVGVRQRRIGRPSEGCCALRSQEITADCDQRAERVQPVGECVQSREGDVGSTDLQRHEHVREAREERRCEYQQHDRAVHREQLVVLLLRRDDVESGRPELGADHQRHHSADAEVEERRDQVHVPDLLVVGGGDPVDQDVALAGCRRRDAGL